MTKKVMDLKDIIPKPTVYSKPHNIYLISFPEASKVHWSEFLEKRNELVASLSEPLLQNAYWLQDYVANNWQEPWAIHTREDHTHAFSCLIKSFYPTERNALMIHSLTPEDLTYLALMGISTKKVSHSGFVFKFLRALRLQKLAYPFIYKTMPVKFRAKLK